MLLPWVRAVIVADLQYHGSPNIGKCPTQLAEGIARRALELYSEMAVQVRDPVIEYGGPVV